MQQSDYPHALRPGTVLHGNGTYTIDRILGAGGFGITYLAYTTFTNGNIKVKGPVAIKEHFMADFASRGTDGTSVLAPTTGKIAAQIEGMRKDFLAEARRLSQLGAGHDNIVKVNEVFEANGTAYYVMEYLEGRSLQDYIKENGPLDSEAIRGLVGPIINAAAYLHANRFTHLDIKPANIMLTTGDAGAVRPVLIDFGLSKHYDENGNATSTINTMGASDGFAPFEQYAGISTFSPAADVYALGATMLTCATGTVPTKSTEWPQGEPERSIQSLPLDSTLKSVITKAMKLQSQDRYRDAGAMEVAMGGNGGGGDTYNMNFREKFVSTPKPQLTEPIKPEPKPRRTGIIIGAIAAVLIIAAIAIFALVGKGDHNDDNLLIAAVDTSATEEVTPIAEVVVTDDVAQQNAEALAQQQAQAEAQRLEQERLEQQRQEQERLEQQRQDQERLEQQRQDQERREQELRERERQEQLHREEQERQERQERERLDRERREREQAAAQAAAQQAAQARLHGTENEHEWVDLGLSVKWATCNVGANNPDDYGTYFAWGETAGKSNYTERTSQTFRNNNPNNITPGSGMDAARANWGGRWRMPTRQELEELKSNCTWTWTTQNGHNGYRVTGPNGQSIFLPAAGWFYRSSPGSGGTYGSYWSSTSNSDPHHAYFLTFDSSSHYVYWIHRYIGRSVRAVLE